MPEVIEMEKENLEKLLNEQGSLSSDLLCAIDANDGLEIVRLKEREKTIGSDVYCAEILALKAEIKELEMQLRLDGQNVLQAKEASKNADSLIGVQIGILREEVQKLNNEALSKLVAVKTSEKAVAETGGKLMKLREKLSLML